MEDTEADSNETDPLVERRRSPHPKEPPPPERPPKCPPEKGPKPHIEQRPPPLPPPPLVPLHESNEEPTLEEVHLPQRKVPNPLKANQQTPPLQAPYMLCPFFGVRNYLPYFYEKPELSPGTSLETREDPFKVKRHPSGICTASVFRLSVLLGVLIIGMGIIAFVIAACASYKSTLVGSIGGIPVEDRVAAVHNAEVDAFYLVGLIAVILGALVLIVALISKTYCSTEDYNNLLREALIRGYPTYYEYPHLIAAAEMKVPTSEELTQVHIQPWLPPKGARCFHHSS